MSPNEQNRGRHEERDGKVSRLAETRREEFWDGVPRLEISNLRTQRLLASLVLPMESGREDIHGATVTVECRVGEKLVVERQATASAERKVVVRLQGLL